VWFFVKCEVPANKVDQFTEMLANNRMKHVEGNESYVTPDGRMGYDFIECPNEKECRNRYADLVSNGLRILEVTPCVPMGQFLQNWQQKHGRQKAA
jgi:hypothetical protein